MASSIPIYLTTLVQLHLLPTRTRTTDREAFTRLNESTPIQAIGARASSLTTPQPLRIDERPIFRLGKGLAGGEAVKKKEGWMWFLIATVFASGRAATSFPAGVKCYSCL